MPRSFDERLAQGHLILYSRLHITDFDRLDEAELADRLAARSTLSP